MSATGTAADELREILEQQLKLLYVQNKDSKTAYQDALRRYGTSYIIRTLEQYQVEAAYRVNFPVHYAVKEGDKGSVKTLLDSLTPEERSQLLFKQDREGNTVLHLAAREGHTETMKIVLDNITPEQHLQLRSIRNKDGNTAHQEAVRRYGTSDIIITTLEQYQIEAGYEVTYPVHYAVKQGDKESVKSLLDSLTPEKQLQFLSTKDKDGKAAVQLAPADVRKDMVKMLNHYKREADFEVNYESLLIENTKSQLHPMIRKLCKKIKTQTAQLVRTQWQNTQLLEINNSLSQTHTDIGLLLTERQKSERDREIITEVRALLDKNNAALSEIVVKADQALTLDIKADNRSAIDTSIDSLSLYSLESIASAAPSVHTKYSKGSKWSQAKPEPLSTYVSPTLRELKLARRHVETTDQATQTPPDDVLPANSTAPDQSGNSSMSLEIYSLTTTTENQDE